MAKSDSYYLDLCLNQAKIALKNGNYPIGSVLVDSHQKIIVQAHNQNATLSDPVAHAEIQCLRLGHLFPPTDQSYTLYSSVEPCCGCAFFVARTNIQRVVWALTDLYHSGISCLKNHPDFESYFKKIELTSEPDEKAHDQSRQLMFDYFTKSDRPEVAKLFK